MATQTAGPIIATGMLATANRVVFNGDPMDWRIPPATALAAIGFGLVERVWPEGAVLLAWTTFAAVLLTRINSQPSPVENALRWWNSTGGKTA